MLCSSKDLNCECNIVESRVVYIEIGCIVVVVGMWYIEWWYKAWCLEWW